MATRIGQEVLEIMCLSLQTVAGSIPAANIAQTAQKEKCMWSKHGEYQWFGKHKKNGTGKRKQAKGCFGNHRNDMKLVKGKPDGTYYR